MVTRKCLRLAVARVTVMQPGGEIPRPVSSIVVYARASGGSSDSRDSDGSISSRSKFRFLQIEHDDRQFGNHSAAIHWGWHHGLGVQFEIFRIVVIPSLQVQQLTLASQDLLLGTKRTLDTHTDIVP